MHALRAIYRYWLALLAAAIVVQIGAAGYGAFYAADHSDPGPLSKDSFEHGFNVHAALGYLIFLAGIVLLLLALGARVGRPLIWRVLAVPVLLIVQILLAWAGWDHPVAGIFHPINAFIILGLVGSLAHRAWRADREQALAPAVAART
jgi:hypothetical protein